MTNPTPTRAEVDALIEQLMLNAPAVPYNARPYDRIMKDAAMMLYALRERAEAAEAERDAARDESLRELMALEVAEHCRAQLTAARRAEAAAWNDAIEAAGNLESIHGYSNAVPRHRIRALRRAAPTEGEA